MEFSRKTNARDLSLLHSFPLFTSNVLFLKKASEFYVETDLGNDDQVTPKLGTFRHAGVEDEPLSHLQTRHDHSSERRTHQEHFEDEKNLYHVPTTHDIMNSILSS